MQTAASRNPPMSLCPFLKPLPEAMGFGRGAEGGTQVGHGAAQTMLLDDTAPCLGFEPVEKEEQLGFTTQATL